MRDWPGGEIDVHVNWKLNVLFLYDMFKRNNKKKTVVMNCDDDELHILTMKNACVSWLERNMSNLFCDKGKRWALLAVLCVDLCWRTGSNGYETELYILCVKKNKNLIVKKKETATVLIKVTFFSDYSISNFCLTHLIDWKKEYYIITPILRYQLINN